MSAAPPIGNLGGTVLGVIADPHIPTTHHAARVRTVLDWIQSHHVSTLLIAGDLNNNPYSTPRWQEWSRDPEGGNLGTLRQIRCLGNHDADAPTEENAGPNPFSYTLGLDDAWLFAGKEWFRWSLGPVSVYGVNNISDYVMANGVWAYPNCNEPGNPDHPGILDPNSEQRLWFEAEVAADSSPWKFVLAHRAMWAPYDSDPRRLNVGARDAMLGPIAHGVSGILQGDIHNGHFGKLPGLPCYSMSLAGGYAVRPTNPALYEGDLYWHSGGTTTSGIAHGAVLYLGEESALVLVFECSDADQVGAVVYSGSMLRNPNL